MNAREAGLLVGLEVHEWHLLFSWTDRSGPCHPVCPGVVVKKRAPAQASLAGAGERAMASVRASAKVADRVRPASSNRAAAPTRSHADSITVARRLISLGNPSLSRPAHGEIGPFICFGRVNG
jgi:hypothetical protein